MKKQRGFTLIEVSVVSVIMAMVLIGTASLLSGTIKSFTYTSNQYDSDLAASTALQIVNRNLQEAKQVQILSPTSIRVFYPVVTANGFYDRRVLDVVNTVDFYRGDENGDRNSEGRYMIRAEANGAMRPICEAVTSLEFRSISPSSVDISLSTETGLDTATRGTEMIHRAIFLRNY